MPQPPTANTRQVAGNHYQSKYQHWDFVWDMGLGYFPGQITKYVSRWRKKNGVQDAEKALHFAHKYLELMRTAGQVTQKARKQTLGGEQPLPARYLQDNGITEVHEVAVIWALSYGSHNYTLIAKVVQDIEALIDVAEREIALAGEPGPGYTNQS